MKTPVAARATKVIAAATNSNTTANIAFAIFLVFLKNNNKKIIRFSLAAGRARQGIWDNTEPSF